jgi:hypothetical protein
MVSQEDAMAKCSNPAKLNDLMYRAGATDPNASKGRMVGQGAGIR